MVSGTKRSAKPAINAQSRSIAKSAPEFGPVCFKKSENSTVSMHGLLSFCAGFDESAGAELWFEVPAPVDSAGEVRCGPDSVFVASVVVCAHFADGELIFGKRG